MSRSLETVREINRAVWENINARAHGVYCTTTDGERCRVCRARSVHGVLQVRLVGGGWVTPLAVFQV